MHPPGRSIVRFGRRKDREPGALHAAYLTACDADDAQAAERLLRELLQLEPDTAWAWFDAGLQSKRRRDWATSMFDNQQALRLSTSTKEDPAAWNLGIAATALGDWDEAARAWAAYGIDVAALAESSHPLVLRLGNAPVRLNAEPRHLGERQLLIGGELRASEVVWCQRLCPARAVIKNVPTPESGHRYGDVVLHDGEPVGERTSGGHTFSVFNELAVLERSSLPTLEVIVSSAEQSGFADLETAFHDRDLGAEDHGTMVMLCKACSEGSPGEHHHATPTEQGRTRTFALGADPTVATALLRDWAEAGPQRTFTEPHQVL